MNKRALGSLLLIIGAVILIASIWKYQNIKGAQAEMLTAHQKLSAEAEIPVVQQGDSINDSKPADVQQAEVKAVSKREDYKNGQMTIAIPKLNIAAAIVEGTSRELLKKGPGLYESSPLPDAAGGNVCIAGHRSTYGAWFRHVDKLKEGDEITLDFNGTVYSYKVEKVFVVDKKDWSVVEPQGYSAITLTSCHPLGSSKQRIVVRGKLVE